jgi:predicted nuclease of predicted toxin-antitoxin system
VHVSYTPRHGHGACYHRLLMRFRCISLSALTPFRRNKSCLAPFTLTLLNEEGFDAVHAADLGLQHASDIEILRQARDAKRICVTLDAAFHAHRVTTAASTPSFGHPHPAREGLNARALASLLRAVWPRVETALDQGAAVTITDSSVRIRRLPIA